MVDLMLLHQDEDDACRTERALRTDTNDYGVSAQDSQSATIFFDAGRHRDCSTQWHNKSTSGSLQQSGNASAMIHCADHNRWKKDMQFNQFVWTDLSTFDLDQARRDYAAMFGWSFQGQDEYDFASVNQSLVAGIFRMPKRLADMKLPSFWMSYVSVEDIDATVASARRHAGAIIEVEPQPFNDNARIALIRDPSGAGFTVYEGPDISDSTPVNGFVVDRYLHVADVSLIDSFYSDLFGWRFERTTDKLWQVFKIVDRGGQPVAWVEEVPESIRGTFNYWMPCFSVLSSTNVLAALADHAGKPFSSLTEGRTMVADRQGAHFMIRQTTEESRSMQLDSTAGNSMNNAPAWRAIAGLGCIWLAVLLDIQAFWGILFLLWTWPVIKSGRADFIDPVPRKTRPILYWSLVATWVTLSLWLLITGLM